MNFHFVLVENNKKKKERKKSSEATHICSNLKKYKGEFHYSRASNCLLLSNQIILIMFMNKKGEQLFLELLVWRQFFFASDFRIHFILLKGIFLLFTLLQLPQFLFSF